MSLDFRRYPVLFVDDEEANRVVFRATFGTEFHVICAASAAEALEVLAKSPVAILLTDQRMPVTTGVELVEVVRREHPNVVRMLVTAYADIQSAMDAINLGHVYRYISKPWKSADVRIYLRDALEHYYLNQRVQELQAEVLKTERLVTLGLAAGSIAHDIGRPLGLLLNNLEGVEQDLLSMCNRISDGKAQGAHPDLGTELREVQETVQQSRVAVEEIARILGAVRASFRVLPRLEPVHLAAVVQSAVKLIQTEVAAKATLRIVCDPEVWVVGEGSALVQVVLNLLVNAAKAITRGPASENLVMLEVFPEGEWAVLRVSDTGCGIPEAIKERIFEPLFTTRGGEGGTGLGLAIVTRAVSRLRGTLSVQSTVDEGSVFTVKLPILSTPP